MPAYFLRYRSTWIVVAVLFLGASLAFSSSDEPLVLGPTPSPADSQKKTETKSPPLEKEPAKGPARAPSLPSNPLRGDQSPIPADGVPNQKAAAAPSAPPAKVESPRAPKATEVKKPTGDENAKDEPSKEAKTKEAKPQNNDEDAPLLLSLEDAETIEQLPPANPPGRPKPRMVEIKPISPDEQESPPLRTVNRADADRSRQEDAEALTANRPLASPKTFVSNAETSRGRSYTGDASTNDPRLERVKNCLAWYMANPESVVERSPWAVMHAMLPFGVEGEIMQGTRRINAIQWMCYNGTCRTQKLFTPVGRSFRPNVGGGVQGHEGQFLAMLAQSQVPVTYPIVVGKNQFTIMDLVRYEMAGCIERSELTFKLIGLSYYVDTNQTWTSNRRSRWNIEKLVKEELEQPINGAACGGTHRLMGLTFAIRQRQAEGRPIDGQFARADRYVKEYINYAWKLQNPDGSFSTNWFESRGNDPNVERKVQTTGHILEWLAFTVPDAELDSPRFAKSIDFLLSKIWEQRDYKWPIGPRGHATRALALYHQRKTGVGPGERHTELAREIDSLRIAR